MKMGKCLVAGPLTQGQHHRVLGVCVCVHMYKYSGLEKLV